MSDGSVNVESRTSSQDKRWTIMAALLGTNTALLLFQGIEQAKSPDNIREFALAVIAAALPFQAIYFLIYTFVLEHEPQLHPNGSGNWTWLLRCAKWSRMHPWVALRSCGTTCLLG